MSVRDVTEKAKEKGETSELPESEKNTSHQKNMKREMLQKVLDSIPTAWLARRFL